MAEMIHAVNVDFTTCTIQSVITPCAMMALFCTICTSTFLREARIINVQANFICYVEVDLVGGHIYITDLRGSVYRFDKDGKGKEVVSETDGAYTGIGVAYI